MIYQIIDRCRLCGSKDLKPTLDLGNQALSGVFPKSCDELVPIGPISLMVCMGECGLIQLAHSYDPTLMYGATYGYRSGLNGSMVEHLTAIAHQIAYIPRYNESPLIVDVGSNDGTLLNAIKARQPEAVCLGVDPSAEKFAAFYRPDVHKEACFFSPDVVRRYFRTPDERPRVITSIAMFYDLDDPVQFASNVKELLADDGVWIVEQAYAPALALKNIYDAVVAEHVAYYGMRQMVWLAEKVGLTIVGGERNNINGESFALALKKKGTGKESALVTDLLTFEAQIPVGRMGWQNLHAAAHRDQFFDVVRGLRRRGQRIFGYGASTKGNALLQFCGFTSDDIECIVDVNPDKVGCVTPGTKIPIVSTDRYTRPDVYLVLPWHFRQGICKREQDFINAGGKLLFPFPYIDIEGRKGLLPL